MIRHQDVSTPNINRHLYKRLCFTETRPSVNEGSNSTRIYINCPVREEIHCHVTEEVKSATVVKPTSFLIFALDQHFLTHDLQEFAKIQRLCTATTPTDRSSRNSTVPVERITNVQPKKCNSIFGTTRSGPIPVFPRTQFDIKESRILTIGEDRFELACFLVHMSRPNNVNCFIQMDEVDERLFLRGKSGTLNI